MPSKLLQCLSEKRGGGDAIRVIVPEYADALARANCTQYAVNSDIHAFQEERIVFPSVVAVKKGPNCLGCCIPTVEEQLHDKRMVRRERF